jgi:hypothetical protein
MSSKRRIEASRRNGALSTGPKTPAGKSRSSQNALKHGILSERVVLEIENKDNFNQAFEHYLDKFDPQDGVEMAMVEQMASCFWRLQRSLTIEKEIFDNAVASHLDGEKSDPRCLVDGFNDLSFGMSLKTIQRYEAMLDRMHTRTLKNLLLLRKMEPNQPKLPNEPNPNFGHLETPPPTPPETHPTTQPDDKISAAPPVSDASPTSTQHSRPEMEPSRSAIAENHPSTLSDLPVRPGLWDDQVSVNGSESVSARYCFSAGTTLGDYLTASNKGAPGAQCGHT